MSGGHDGGDDLLFVDDTEDDVAASSAQAAPPWKVLIVDDDPEVHAITRVVLGDVVFEGRRIEFLSAHSGAVARDIVRAHGDIAVILLDVVMETDDAGLKLVHFIRQDLGNQAVRIILRTGQPGQAPERQVIVNYDINDYKAKSELTAQKLFTATVAALRSYQHIATIEHSRRGLEKIIDAASALFEQRSLRQFVEGVVLQMGSLLTESRGSLLCTARTCGEAGRMVEVLAGSGAFEGLAGPLGRLDVGSEVAAAVDQAYREQRNVYGQDHCALLFRSRNHAVSVVYVAAPSTLSDVDRQVIEIFCAKMAVGFDNVYLYEQLVNAQRAAVHALGKLAEFKDEATGDHVRRIGRMSTRIALELRRRGLFSDTLDDAFCEQIGLASMLHDVGKVGIPDNILRKPGRLEPQEMTAMREHARIGAVILHEASDKVDGRSYLKLGAEIAESHHEKFDGSGYPAGLSGDAIPLAGRIVAVADVYDALMHRRPYKEAWRVEEAVDLIRRESGRHFDPRVVDAFLHVLAEDAGVPA